MTESSGFVCYVSVITNGAGVCGVAAVGAIRSSNNCIVLVTESGNYCACAYNFVTIGANGVAGEAFGGAGSIGCAFNSGVGVFTFRCVRVNDVELDGVDHCSYATGDSNKGNGLVNGGVNGDFVIRTVVGILCQSVCCFVNSNLGGTSLVFCNVNNNLYYFLRNGEGKGSGFAGGTQLNARIML